MNATMARMMKAMGQDVPKQPRILELNPKHPVLARLADELKSPTRDDEAFLVSKNCQVFRAPLLHVQDSGVIRHHSARLAESLMRVYRRLESGQKK